MTDAVPRYDRRALFGRGAALALAGLAAPVALDACGGGGGTSPGTSSQPGVGMGTPRRGGTLTIGINSEINGFLPAVDHFDNTGICYANAVFDTLTKVGADGTARPYLAQSVTPNADMSVWTITLRPGVVFHDGSPLTADVLVANFQALRQSPLTGQAVAPISGVTATGPLTVQMTASQPLVAFPYYLSTQVGYVVALSMLSDPNGSSRPVGTGPFSLVSWVPNDHFTVQRNPRYWRQGLPYLDGVTFKPIIQDTSRESSLRSGTVDLMVTRDPQAIADLRHNASFAQIQDQRVAPGMGDMDFIILNTAVPPVNDLTVRQALAHATDAEQLTKLFGAGIAKADSSPFPLGSPFRAPDNGYPAHDLAAAKRLVAQAAPAHGGRISVALGTISDPRQLEIVQAVQSMWQQAGIDVTVNQTEQVTYINGLVLGSFVADTDEQFSAPDPDLNYVWWSSTTAAGPGKIALNFARNSDAQLEAALITGRTHSDPAVRAQAYQTVDKRLAADLPYLWISRATWSLTARSGVTNFASPTLPDGGRALAFTGGTFTPTEIWLTR
ncbi:MAG: ABC transporter substrate-binding protein [Acidimicrobiales bacterium]